jgi:hypothetical protein
VKGCSVLFEHQIVTDFKLYFFLFTLNVVGCVTANHAHGSEITTSTPFSALQLFLRARISSSTQQGKAV